MGVYDGILTELERLSPGSVRLEKDGLITLIGWHLEKFDYAIYDQCKAKHIKCVTHHAAFPGVPRNFRARAAEGVKHKPFLVRMIYPLPQPPEEEAGRNTCGYCCRVGGKQASTIDQKNKASDHDYHFVPVVKSKHSQRVLHFFTRLFGR